MLPTGSTMATRKRTRVKRLEKILITGCCVWFYCFCSIPILWVQVEECKIICI
ncbi:hypothetical protein HanRHA438_Chr14g0640651 [Helianthus annuus]|nr:hypothetical protein HanRHA438_Chr14g0640651 [Helianthus annuus]